MSESATVHRAIPGASPSYSAGVSHGSIIVTSGHLGAAPGGAPVPFGEQAERALDALVETVTQLGGSAKTILKINAYLADMADFPAWDRIWRERLALDPMPARTSVQVGGFIDPLLVELDCIAYRADAAGPADTHLTDDGGASR